MQSSTKIEEISYDKRVQLQNVRATAELEQRLAQAEAEKAKYELVDADGSYDRIRQSNLQRAVSDIKNATWELERARLRDQIQATRPEGCWCLGVGGKGERWLPQVFDQEDDDDYEGDTRADQEDANRGFDAFCECPEGVEAKGRFTAYEERYRRWKRIRSFRKIIGDAGLGRYQRFTFDTYLDEVRAKLGTVPEANAEYVRSLQDWADDAGSDERGGPWLYVYGPYGTGKTGLAASIARALTKHGINDICLIAVPDLLRKIMDTFTREKGDPRTSEVLDAFREVEILMLDDLGQENTTPWAMSELWSLVNARYKAEMTTVITSNLTPVELAKRHGLGLAERILEKCTVLEIAGPNLRVKGQRRAQPASQGPAKGVVPSAFTAAMSRQN